MTTILIVDDLPDIRGALAAILEDAGYDVEERDNGDDLPVEVAATGADLVLLDVMLGGKSGIDALRALRRSGPHKSVPVIIVSAKGQSADVEEALDAGANDYIVKPWGRGEVEERVARHLPA